jgi:hypothetical protein
MKEGRKEDSSSSSISLGAVQLQLQRIGGMFEMNKMDLEGGTG